MPKSAPTPLEHSLLDTQALPSSDRFDIWRASTAHVFDTSLFNDSKSTDFSARVEAFNLGSLVIIDTQASGHQFRRDASVRANEGLDHYLLQLYLESGYYGQHMGRDIHVDAGDIGILDLGRDFRTHSTAQHFRCLSIVIPRDVLYPLVNNGNALTGMVIKGNTTLGRLLANHLKSVWQVMPGTAAHEAVHITDSLLSMLSASINAHPDSQFPDAAIAHKALTSQIQDYIEQSLSDPDLNPKNICQRVGCSRSQLYRLFQPMGGIANYINERRLQRCYHALVHETRFANRGRISHVAYSWGFNSQSHFSRLFRKQFGISPSDAMDLGLSHASDDTFKLHEDSDTRIDIPDWYHWLKGL